MIRNFLACYLNWVFFGVIKIRSDRGCPSQLIFHRHDCIVWPRALSKVFLFFIQHPSKLWIFFWQVLFLVHGHLHKEHFTYFFLPVHTCDFFLDEFIIRFDSFDKATIFLNFLLFLIGIIKTFDFIIAFPCFGFFSRIVDIWHIFRSVNPCWGIKTRGVESGVLHWIFEKGWILSSSAFADGVEMAGFEVAVRNGDKFGTQVFEVQVGYVLAWWFHGR